MTSGRKVALLFGGSSVEHEVSVNSARGVDKAMAATDLTCVPIAVTGTGRWLAPETSRAILDGRQARVEAGDGDRIAIEPGSGGMVRLVEGSGPRSLEVDVVFPLIHGWGGEDGRLQGALELAGIPYVGAGVLGSAAGMDKAVAKRLFEAQGLPGVPWMDFRRAAWPRMKTSARHRIETELGFPVFVKPANGGSSVGISRVDRPADLDRAMDDAFDCDEKVIVERGVNAREIECAVLGNDAPETSVPGEIVPSREFYDYGSKYLDGTSELKIPAPLEPDLVQTLRAHAVSAYRCLGLAGFARVDFLVDRDSGQAYLNEVNTLPGFTPISMFPKLWEATGLAYADLIVRLVDLALDRWRTESRRRTQYRNP